MHLNFAEDEYLSIGNKFLTHLASFTVKDLLITYLSSTWEGRGPGVMVENSGWPSSSLGKSCDRPAMALKRGMTEPYDRGSKYATEPHSIAGTPEIGCGFQRGSP